MKRLSVLTILTLVFNATGSMWSDTDTTTPYGSTTSTDRSAN